jgi:hypothetical protein
MVDKAERIKVSACRHREHIINEILTLKCPHCSMVVVDFGGCFSVEHSADASSTRLRQGCGRHFCGWCLGPFENSSACHAHVKVCSKSLRPGNYYGEEGDFTKVHALSRKTRTEAYLLTISDEEERSEAKKCISKDLEDLGISLISEEDKKKQQQPVDPPKSDQQGSANLFAAAAAPAGGGINNPFANGAGIAGGFNGRL